jgi:fusion and transport protein UGO1
MASPAPFADAARPLRPYAVQPDLDAAFDLPLRPVAGPSTSSSHRVQAPSSSSRLSPGATAEAYVDLDEPATSFLRAATAAGLLGFASTALVMPFDVGKTLLQVQWIPKDDIAAAELEPEHRETADDEDEVRWP